MNRAVEEWKKDDWIVEKGGKMGSRRGEER
jgi:hypothetical protein